MEKVSDEQYQGPMTGETGQSIVEGAVKNMSNDIVVSGASFGANQGGYHD
jgi:hypothetical protein